MLYPPELRARKIKHLDEKQHLLSLCHTRRIQVQFSKGAFKNEYTSEASQAEPIAHDKLFERFVTERRYLNNVTAKTIIWYWSSWKALGRPVLGFGAVAGPSKAAWTTQVSALRAR